MKKRGLEGVIAKRADSTYERGRRSSAWVKFKWVSEQEFVIGGFTRPKGARSYFGAILVGHYQGKRLVFAGKVGSGFDRKNLGSLFGKFQKLTQRDSPFAGLPKTAGQIGPCTWVRPRLVSQVRFSEWTRDGQLRQPVFLGLRDDKEPKEIVAERPGGVTKK
jgi:bifunctional non-homologous end joining protein LigD